MESVRCVSHDAPITRVATASWHERDSGSISSAMNPDSTMVTTASSAVIVMKDMLVAVKVTVHGRPEPQPISVHIGKMVARIAPIAKCPASWDAGCMVRASTAAGEAAATTNMAGMRRSMPLVRVVPTARDRVDVATAEGRLVSARCAQSASRLITSSDSGAACYILRGGSHDAGRGRRATPDQERNSQDLPV